MNLPIHLRLFLGIVLGLNPVFVNTVTGASLPEIAVPEHSANESAAPPLFIGPLKPITRQVDVRVHRTSKLHIDEQTLRDRLGFANRVLGQCGVKLRFLDAGTLPTAGFNLDESKQIAIANSTPASELRIYVVNNLIRINPGGGVVSPLGRAWYARDEPESLLGTVWVSEFAFIDMQIPEAPKSAAHHSVLAHEVVHALCRCRHIPPSEIDPARGHLMAGSGSMRLVSNYLDDAYCQRINN